MKRMGLISCLSLGLFLIDVGAAELSFNLQGAYYIPHWEGYGETGFVYPEYSVMEGNEAPQAKRDLGSSWGGVELKSVLSISEAFPVLVQPNPLMKGNKLTLTGTLELSPISFNTVFQASLTPIAFLVFDAGASLGTGWNLGPIQGLGINPVGNEVSDIELTPFGGVVYRIWGTGTFQFDLAALLPGPWNHVVTLASAKLEYKAFTGASSKEAWLWEADTGENFNGLKLGMTYVLGYQMPLVVDMVGILAESEEWLGSVRDLSPMDTGWGSDFRSWVLGTLTSISLSEKDSLVILAQLKYKGDYSDENTRNRDFRTRSYEDAYWCFHRIAFSYTRVL